MNNTTFITKKTLILFFASLFIHIKIIYIVSLPKLYLKEKPYFCNK